MIKIAPSILSSNFMQLGEEIKNIGENGADYIHVDVMDGSFVPNITVGIPVVEGIRAVTKLPLDVHLMIERPERYTRRFIEAGADIISIHAEADEPEGIGRALASIHGAGKCASLAVKPGTGTEMIRPYLPLLGMVLVMTVEPGFGGQAFIPEMLEKIAGLRGELERAERTDCKIEVDGGINSETAGACIRAGATVLVSGSWIFGSSDRAARICALRRG